MCGKGIKPAESVPHQSCIGAWALWESDHTTAGTGGPYLIYISQFELWEPGQRGEVRLPHPLGAFRGLRRSQNPIAVNRLYPKL